MRSTMSRSSIGFMSSVAFLSLALAGGSDAFSQEVSGPNFFDLSITTERHSLPLPAAAGLYQVDSFAYYCDFNPGVVFLDVGAGPDKGLTVALPASGNDEGGGPLRFWLHAADQVEIVDTPGSASCQLHLFGQIVPGTVLKLQ